MKCGWKMGWKNLWKMLDQMCAIKQKWTQPAAASVQLPGALRKAVRVDKYECGESARFGDVCALFVIFVMCIIISSQYRRTMPHRSQHVALYILL